MNNEGQSILEAMILMSGLFIIVMALTSLFYFGKLKFDAMVDSRNYFFSILENTKNRSIKTKSKKRSVKKIYENPINNKKELIENTYYGII